MIEIYNFFAITLGWNMLWSSIGLGLVVGTGIAIIGSIIKKIIRG